MPCGGVATAAAVPWFLVVVTSGGEPVASSSVLLLVLRGGGMLWATLECFRYSARLRKRAALGLGDPIIAHRIWLWELGAVTAGTFLNIQLGDQSPLTIEYSRTSPGTGGRSEQ